MSEQPTADIDIDDAGPHSLYRAYRGGFECCRCDMSFESPADAKRRPCVSFGAW